VSCAVVTGASRGLGAALAEELQRRGYDVGLCAISSPALPNALCRAVDVVDETGVDSFAQEVAERFGPIELWVNNAGVIGPIGLTRDTPSSAWATCVAINVLGVVNGCRALLHHRAATATLVNIASRAGIHGAAGLAPYSATKAAVIALTRSIAAEEGQMGVRAIVVVPPSIDTDMQDTLLAQDAAVFPAVTQSRLRRDTGRVIPAPSAARLILDHVSEFDHRKVLLDLTEDG
jgi:NAD(P)-dependent dehydrogenase (short-subunit alcohol dehydrogenase family)